MWNRANSIALGNAAVRFFYCCTTRRNTFASTPWKMHMRHYLRMLTESPRLLCESTFPGAAKGEMNATIVQSISLLTHTRAAPPSNVGAAKVWTSAALLRRRKRTAGDHSSASIVRLLSDDGDRARATSSVARVFDAAGARCQRALGGEALLLQQLDCAGISDRIRLGNIKHRV